VPNWL